MAKSMNSGLLSYWPGRATAKWVLTAAAILSITAAVYNIQAQGYIASAQLSSQAVGDGSYNYSITLNNSASSTTPIGTFWFAWVPDVYGYDLLTAMPASVQAPSGWEGDITGGYGYYYPDGYGIEFITDGAPLAPGSSLTFGFNSTDSPDVLAATSPYFNATATTSTLYSGYAEGDPGAEIGVPQVSVPEPCAVSLLTLAGAGLIFAGQLRRSQLQKSPIHITTVEKPL